MRQLALVALRSRGLASSATPISGDFFATALAQIERANEARLEEIRLANERERMANEARLAEMRLANEKMEKEKDARLKDKDARLEQMRLANEKMEKDKDARLKDKDARLEQMRLANETLKTEAMRLSGHLHVRGLIIELENEFRSANPRKDVSRTQLWTQALEHRPNLANSLGDCMQWERGQIPHGSNSREEALAKMINALFGRASAKAHPDFRKGQLPKFPDGTDSEKCIVERLCAQLGVDATKVLDGEAEECAIGLDETDV